MSVAWASFTPLESFIGGCLIGLAALLLMALKGRVMGISGILSGIVAPTGTGERGWRLMFLGGAILGPVIWQVIAGSPIAWQAVASGPQFYIAAFLVGVGTAIGSGCTSGHGICGLARMSPRSLVAVLAFMVSAIATVALIKLV
ncbi:MAG: YeeE/YedE family protein [Candidatus Puniceispirillum sp.]|jgi:uncharacterized membrane protein YedE/YeeE|nr:YeeE/YedE family protein [Alphaproteobacteria bacterium]